MYYQCHTSFSIDKVKCIVLLLIICPLWMVKSQFFLSTLKIASPSQSFTVPYNKTLPGTQLAFAYFIECGTIYQNNLKLRHQQNQTSVVYDRFSIKFIIDGVITMNNVDEFLQVKVLISSYDPTLITLSMISTPPLKGVSIPLPCVYDPSAIIKSLQPKVFPTVLPMTQTLTLNQTHLTILPTLTPTGIASISFSVLIITREYESLNIGLIIDNLQLGNLGWIILFNNDIFFNPSITNMLIGITGYQIAMNPVINMQDEVDYEFSFPLYLNQRSVFIFYDIHLTTPSIFTTCIFIFNENFTNCVNHGFLTYTELYYDSPLSCQSCHPTCLTCTGTNYSLTLTDETCCLTCSALKYFDVNDTSSNTGRCNCYPGLKVNQTNQQCIPCTQDCLGFTVNFMRSSTQSLFLLSFSQLTTQSIPISQNLRIYVNNNFTANISYQITEMKINFYKIIVENEGLKPCETNCQINFTFIKPWLILKQDNYEALTQNTQSLYIENYYNVKDKIPDQVNNIFAIISLIVGATSAGGLSNLLKMLFELQQIIEFHKYMTMELPLIFKEFIESLSIFKFLDVTTLFPFDIESFLQTLSTNNFDTKGPIKYVYYDEGANFYKNIVPVLFSFGIVISMNFFVFFTLRLIPFKFCWKLSQKLRIRAIITFSDLLETLILPTIVYSNVQLFIICYQIDIIWIYVLTMIVAFAVLSLPFLIIAYVFVNRHRKQAQEVYSDLMQDCHLNKNATYVFYIFTFYRKVLFGMLLFDMIPSTIQGFSILFINISYLGMICYIVYSRIFYSKIKMFTKTLNAVCVISIQIIMIYYNSKTHSIKVMLDLGASCVYLAIISTVVGVIEAFIKLFEIIFQNIYEIKEQVKVVDNETTNKTKLQKSPSIQKRLSNEMHFKQNDTSIQKITSMNSKDTIETIDFELNDKRSLWNRPRRKFNFLTHFLNRQKNINSNQSINPPSNQLDKEQQQSFDKIKDQQEVNDFISVNSNDELRNQGKSKNYFLNSSRRREKKTLQLNQNKEKMSDMMKKFNFIQESNKHESKRSISQDKDQNYVQFPALRRSQRRKRYKKQTNNLQINNQKFQIHQQ